LFRTSRLQPAYTWISGTIVFFGPLAHDMGASSVPAVTLSGIYCQMAICQELVG